ncbi:MAG: hypothetical protein ACK4N5_16780, partial [Myxococcales bacterium]
ASQGPEPRTGADATQTYHGSEHLAHVVAVKLDGSDPRTIYFNDGGTADLPFFLRNGNVAFHTWNLERMDRHLYTQATADGNMELPVLFGRVQGPNMWGKAVQLENGLLLGTTGRRRSQIDNYVLFVAEHTLGTGADAAFQPMHILDRAVFEQMPDFPSGYCQNPPSGPGCVIDRYYADPAWAPDGRAFVAHNPETTYASQGEQMYLHYAKGSTQQQRIDSLAQWVPKRLGISLVDHAGNLTRVLEPPAGKSLRFPAWVGRRHPPRVQPWRTDESAGWSDLHIADVPLWLSFRFQDGTVKRALHQTLSRIVSLRVLEKVYEDNACLNDNRIYRNAVNSGAHDHPTHLGINNATAYVRLSPPPSADDGFGDVRLEPDRSVFLRLPAGRPLLFQGIDAQGHVVWQRARLLMLPPGQRTDTSVPRAAYRSQCAPCHGTVDEQPFVGLGAVDQLPLVPTTLPTAASAKAPVELTAGNSRKPLTWLHTVRPLVDRACLGCHSGAAPKGELSLESRYSDTANYPAGKWASQSGLVDAAYKAFMQSAPRTPGYNWSPSMAW